MKTLRFAPTVNERFGRLVVLTETFTNQGRRRVEHVVRVRCDCGQERTIRVRHLYSKTPQRSCGCARRKTPSHGWRTPLYGVWSAMKTRCYNPNADNFKYYGGRGVGVCEEWRTEYSAFREWALSHGYVDGVELDREDNDGNYCPENCRFLSTAEHKRKHVGHLTN